MWRCGDVALYASSMCGIAGILKIHPPGAAPPPPEIAVPESWLDILDESIKHRGPDGQGRFRDRAVRKDGSVVDVAMVHRRLAIIDRADGHQPMVSPRGRNEGEGLVAVAFNGCIYNHRELRKELMAAGHRFETDHSDTEVLVHGWREWGARIVDHLDGMYAAAIWDRNAGTTTFIRDRAGEKPLHVWAPSREFRAGRVTAFSSVPGVLLRLARNLMPLRSRMSPLDLWCWLSFGMGPPIGYDVYSVGPGHASSIGAGPLIDGKLNYASVYPPRSSVAQLNVERTDDLLRAAVRSRLDADVPLGCFLSGGVDSSLVAKYAAERVAGLPTFTVRMPDPRMDESKHASSVARLLGTRHTTLECAANPSTDLPMLIEELGQPLGDSSLLPTYWMSKAASRHVRVAIGGDGGDELFCGYDRYRAARWIDRIHAMVGRGSHEMFEVLANARHPRVRRFGEALLGHGYVELLRVFGRSDAMALGCPRNLELPMNACFPVGPFPSVDPGALARIPELHPLLLESAEYDPPRFDFSYYLSYDLMCKVDTASMNVALEVRSPMLANDVVAAALAEPISSLMPRGRRKGLLRQVARKYLPSEIVDRPKQGFAIPIGEWFRTDYGGMKQLLMDHLNSAEPWGPPSLGIDLNMNFVRRMLDEHMGTGMSGRVTRDHSQRLYMLLVLSIWAKWLGGLAK
jgi:asparagine synthase (glutamine-hydrolysing)